jgi:hypothetical protein
MKPDRGSRGSGKGGGRRSSRYVPGERGWIKTKNRAYWRYEMERGRGAPSAHVVPGVYRI